MTYQENLQKARKKIEFADHMVYITFPLIKENKLIIKILAEINNALKILITSILQYEYEYKRIRLYKNPDINFQTFARISEKYSISQKEITEIKEILFLIKKHENSSFEFSKAEKFIIMANSQAISISLEKIKNYLNTVKNLLKKAEIIDRKSVV